MTAVRTLSGPIDLAACTPAVHDHVAAVGHGPAAFATTVAQVLDRASPSDLVVVCGPLDSTTPTGARVLREGFDRGCLMLLNPADAYGALDGPHGLDATTAGFDRVVDRALADGYRAVRIVADDTDRLVASTPADRDRWLAWEQATDAWQVRRPVTGVCWFDADRVAAADLRAVAQRHARASGLVVPWRVFHRPDPEADGHTRLAVGGDVDAFEVTAFHAALWGAAAALPAASRRPGASVVVDVADVRFLHHRALDALADLAPPVGTVRLAHAGGALRRVLAVLDDWPEVVAG